MAWLFKIETLPGAALLYTEKCIKEKEPPRHIFKKIITSQFICTSCYELLLIIRESYIHCSDLSFPTFCKLLALWSFPGLCFDLLWYNSFISFFLYTLLGVPNPFYLIFFQSSFPNLYFILFWISFNFLISLQKLCI